MANEIRTFIALELEAAQREALGRIQQELKAERAARSVRWVAPEGIHLTLKFLGAVDADRMPSLQHSLAGACKGVAPFTLTLDGLGAFPNTRRPNVLWVGIEGDVNSAVRLAEQIDRACSELGFPPETRPFSPHLTLGRVKRDVRPSEQQLVGQMIAGAKVGEIGEFRAGHVSIMKSDLNPTGSVYTRLAAIELKDDGAPTAEQR